MLPHGTNRESVTSFPAMLVILGAMALVAAGGGDYMENNVKEHHGKLASISLDGIALMEKTCNMGFGGRNSTWSNDFKEMATTRGSMALGCKGAQWTDDGELRVRGLGACEKRKGDLPAHGVRVPVTDGCDRGGLDAHGVQVPMDVADGDLRGHGVQVFMHKMEKLEVQVLDNQHKMEKLKVQVLGNRNSHNASEEIETAGSSNMLACEKCEKC